MDVWCWAEWKKSEELRELLGLELVSLMVKRVGWDGLDMLNKKVGQMLYEVGGWRNWWDCVKNDIESLGLSQKDAQFRNKRRRRIKGAIG